MSDIKVGDTVSGILEVYFPGGNPGHRTGNGIFRSIETGREVFFKSDGILPYSEYGPLKHGRKVQGVVIRMNDDNCNFYVASSVRNAKKRRIAAFFAKIHEYVDGKILNFLKSM